MNPYQDEEHREKIRQMQIEVNEASQAWRAAQRAHSPDADELGNEYRTLNRELQSYIDEIRRS